MNREFFPSCYSDVMSRQYQKITSQQRRFCALEEAIFTVFGRSHNWWGAFSWKGLPCRPSWWNLFPFFMFTQQQELHSGRFLHATFTSQSAKPTQRSVLLRDGIERPFCSLVIRLYFTWDQFISFFYQKLSASNMIFNAAVLLIFVGS